MALVECRYCGRPPEEHEPRGRACPESDELKPQWLRNAEKRSAAEARALTAVNRVRKRLRHEAELVERMEFANPADRAGTVDELLRLAEMLDEQMDVIRRALIPDSDG